MSALKHTTRLILLTAFLSSNATASDDTKSARIDLIIGGAESRALVLNPRSITFGLGYDLEPLVNCSNSSLEDVVKASFDTGQFKYIQSQLTQMLYSSMDLGSLAGTVIRKMYPDEYDTIMSGIAETKISWLNALTQCGAAQEALWDATVGGGLSKQNKAYAWGEFSAKAKGGVFNFAEDWVKMTGSSDGINIGGAKKGGDNQLPIKIPADVTKQSYSKFRDNSGGNEAEQSIDAYFKTEKELNDFIQDLVGSRELRMCEQCEPVKSTAGVGIKPFLKNEKNRVKLELAKILKMEQEDFLAIEPSDLQSISTNSKIPLDTYLIQSLKMLDPYRQQAYLDSWADEIAIANVMEKTLAARRVLNAGLSEGSIARSSGVVDSTKEVLASMDYELDELERELRLSKLLSNSTSSAILLQRSMQEGQGISNPTGIIQ